MVDESSLQTLNVGYTKVTLNAEDLADDRSSSASSSIEARASTSKIPVFKAVPSSPQQLGKSGREQGVEKDNDGTGFPLSHRQEKHETMVNT